MRSYRRCGAPIRTPNSAFASAWRPGGLRRRFRHGPDLRQHPTEVAAQDAADVGVGVLAADEPLGEIVHALRVIDALDVDLLAEAVAPLVAGAQPTVLLGRHVVIAVEVDVAADPEVLRADELGHVIVVIEKVLDRRRLVTLDEHPHAGDAHDAAAPAIA